MSDSGERALVGRLKSMDDEAWSEFAGAYGRLLFAHVTARFACGPERAEEIVEMTFVRAVRSMKTFDASRGTLLAWLKAVAANEGHTLARSDARRAGTPLSALPAHVAEAALASIDNSPLPEELLEREDFRREVRETLDLLDERYSRALVWKYIEGLKVSEIAHRTGRSEKAVESLLSRARKAFREAFGRRLKTGGAEESSP